MNISGVGRTELEAMVSNQKVLITHQDMALTKQVQSKMQLLRKLQAANKRLLAIQLLARPADDHEESCATNGPYAGMPNVGGVYEACDCSYQEISKLIEHDEKNYPPFPIQLQRGESILIDPSVKDYGGMIVSVERITVHCIAEDGTKLVIDGSCIVHTKKDT